MAAIKPPVYREIINELVRVCHEGQGQIASRRARAGLWNIHATPTNLPDQHAINQWLARQSVQEREMLASLLAQQVETGVFETLKVLQQFDIAPFDSGYEGDPIHDLVGRLDDWEWPAER